MIEYLLLIGNTVFGFWGLSTLFLIRILLIVFLILINVTKFKKNAFKLFINVLLIPVTSVWLSINEVEINNVYLSGYLGDSIKRILVKYYTMDSLEIFFALSLFAIAISARRFLVIRWFFKILYYLYKLMFLTVGLLVKLLFGCLKSIGYILGKKSKKQSNVYMEQDTFWSDLFRSPEKDVRIVVKNDKNVTSSSFLKFSKSAANVQEQTSSVEKPVEQQPQKKMSSEDLINSLFRQNPKIEDDRDEQSEVDVLPIQTALQKKYTDYVLPEIERPVIRPQEMDINNDDLGQILENKLENFGIKGKVVSITQGPAVTLFEYQPSVNTRISTILAREDDLALALQAISLRIIAPIPGKSVVGFELSRKKREVISFAELINSSEFTDFEGYLPMILGKDTLGNNVVVDLVTLPHLLVAGSTGSGKSVGLNCILNSLLCCKSPDELKLILIDPKRLEFSYYNDIAHLIFPVIVDPSRAIQALKWVIKAMEERYDIMAQSNVRNIFEYNKLDGIEPMSFIVIIIDELADLMFTGGKDVELLLTRIAQMARAAGIHLIVATQRPSVDVITGLIKANFPSRIAYRVTSKIDSRVILDGHGAEKLLGRGDMLYSDNKGMLHRLHGAYLSDAEIATIVGEIKAQREPHYEDLNELASAMDGERDAIYSEIVNYLKSKEEISISSLQRAFKIGYNRSARIIDQLEIDGLILPASGSKLRRVLKD